MERAASTVIESLGVYLPPRAVSTEEVLRDCAVPIRFPLEKMTGIVNRRMAGESEFALDLTHKAIESCLAKSRRTAADIDLLLCCHIARYDGPGSVTYEPASSLVLKNRFGMDHAMAFDITNACAGMFSGIYLIDILLRAGMIRCGMVASGEYITHLTRTAQKEIRNFLDPRLACLTLGDAGAAVILQRATQPGVGFNALDLFTLGKYSSLCIAKPTDQQHGGAIMLTDSIRATAAVVEHTADHAAYVLRKSPYPLEAFRHIIPHQTSRMSIKEGLSEISRIFDKNLDGAVVDNVAHRGNTASTSHFVALMDRILDRRINAHDHAIFCFSGSGITIGTALYTFDDLPDRLRAAPSVKEGSRIAASPVTAKWFPDAFPQHPRVRIESTGTATRGPARLDTRELIRLAAEDCLQRSSRDRREVDLLIHAGLYRTDFIGEPAAAAMAAGDLKLNDSVKPDAPHTTAALDFINGSLGFLNACAMATGLVRADRRKRVMITAAEAENDAAISSSERRGLVETGSAVLLDASPEGRSGFGTFLFKYFADYLDCFTACTTDKEGPTRLVVQRSPRLEEFFLQCLRETFLEFLAAEKLDRSQLRAILPPQISASFLERLADVLGVEKTQIVDVTQDGGDLFSSSTACAMRRIEESRAVEPGAMSLILGVSAGIQVGCALYHF